MPKHLKRIAGVLLALACLAAGGESRADDPADPIQFYRIEGGTFTMGAENTDSMSSVYSTPLHEVTIKTFEIARTLVTVEQYQQCIDDGKCGAPGTGEFCNWGKPERRKHPINCVTWKDAIDFATFKKARLPSEAEYEYAMTSEGKNRPYPWGPQEPDCAKVATCGNGCGGCGSQGTMPVCSKPAGNTEQGLCDMVGEVWEYTQDTWHKSYKGAPKDGRAWVTGGGKRRVVRGGSFLSFDPMNMRSDFRSLDDPNYRYASVGFRLAR